MYATVEDVLDDWVSCTDAQIGHDDASDVLEPHRGEVPVAALGEIQAREGSEVNTNE